MKHLKKFNESLFINNKEKFLNKFKIDIEDIEDYLTELSDEYDVLIFSMEDHPKVRAKIISLTKLTYADKCSFSIMINNNKSQDFQPNDVMKKMKTFINRIESKYKHIKFDSYKLNEYPKANTAAMDDISGLKSAEYIFRINN